MNPPSALHGAMSRDRKPFTYTPGGLDLSEIKSERMAKRLMRNAMNEGVPQQPVQHIQSPSAATIAVPNFNCLPVQVFPAFNLPANPKSLLRTRSNPVTRDPPSSRVESQFVNNKVPAQYDTFSKNTPSYSQINNNRPTPVYEYGTSTPFTNYGSNAYNTFTANDEAVPQMSYDAQYYQATRNNNKVENPAPLVSLQSDIRDENSKSNKNEVSFSFKNELANSDIRERHKEITFTPKIDLICDYNQIKREELCAPRANTEPVHEVKPEILTATPEVIISSVPELPIPEDVGFNDEQKQVKFVTKESTKETKTEEQNGDTEVTANLPPASEVSSAKTATKVEISKKALPDGSVEEVKKTITTTTIDGKTEIRTKTETTIIPKDDEEESTKATKTEEQNGDTEAIVTANLPPAPVVSSAKTATKVEISKKALPDGSVEEVKKTITTTTIDGKTEIRTKTETTIIPKDEEEEEEVEEEEEEEETLEDNVKPVTLTIQADKLSTQVKENGQDNIIKTEEKSETTTTSTKKVVVIQNDTDEESEQEEEEEEEQIEESEPVTVVLKKPVQPVSSKEELEDDEEVVLEEEKEEEEVQSPNASEVEEVVVKIEQKIKSDVQKEPEEQDEEEEVVEEEEQYEEAEGKEVNIEGENKSETTEVVKTVEKEEDEVSEIEELEDSKKSVDQNKVPFEETKTTVGETQATVEEPEKPAEKPAPVEVEIPIQTEIDDKQEVVVEKLEQVNLIVTEEAKSEKLETPETKVPLREPSVPLERVEEVEIKPIGAGNIIRKTSKETTEIITGVPDKPTGLLTEFNRTENIVTVNRTTKTLEYENAPSQTIPTLTYFTPHIEKFPPPPQATNRPYQPVYPSEPTSERRHSLLLERLSVERHVPTTEIYQNTQQYSQNIEQQNQWAQEPRVEILTVENVKPSSITNQQWYQQTEKKDVIYNNMAQAPPVAPSWTQPKQHPVYEPVYHTPSQPAYQPPSQPAYEPPTQPTYQASTQPSYQPQPSYQAPKPVYQPPQPQPAYQTQPQYQPQPTKPHTPQYQSYTDTLQQNTLSQQNNYTSQQYTPKPTWATNVDTPSTQNQYTSDSYQSQQLSSTYVPPPWEQDSKYVVDNSQNYYQPPPQSTITPDLNQSWKPTPPVGKFNKTTSTAYIPPKPNQSFVRHVTIAEPPKQPGRKTYYSEYERRYISVPESTYIPGETKPQPQPMQAQPDASPAYYSDTNEPTEQVEHQWRKELREFTEKAQTQPENVKPPWETSTQTKTETQYAKTQETTYTATPTWSQTLRPQSWRERSFESEFVSQDWSKTSTLGRGRPLSSYGREVSTPVRTRGVSVDRYNPNNYQSPVPEPHSPVQTFTHNPPAPHGPGYHNPNVPAYHASRASAEPREQPVYQQPRARVDSRASPYQSRSFKYLQWITGTDD